MSEPIEQNKTYMLAMELAVDIYRATEGWAGDDLTKETRHCAVEIPSKISEGYSQPDMKDYIHFLFLSRDLVHSTVVRLKIGIALGRTPPPAYVFEKLTSVSKMLFAAIRSLEAKGA